MTLFLLIIIAVMVLVTMVCSIINTTLMLKEKKVSELLRRILSITGIVLLIVIVLGAAFGASNIKEDKDGKTSNKTSENETKTSALEEAGFNEVTLDEYLSLIKEPEKNIILVARPTCGYCEAFAPILSEVAKDLKLKINYIDTDKFSQDDWPIFTESLSYLNSEQWGTPLTLIVQNGELLAKNNGYAELDNIKNFFKDNGFGE